MQRLDRIQLRRPGCRYGAENYSYERRYGDSNDGREAGDRNAVLGEKAYRKRQRQPQNSSHNSTRERNQYRLSQKLQPDLAPRGANGFANPNFADARTDIGQHDVHNTDAAYDQD